MQALAHVKEQIAKGNIKRVPGPLIQEIVRINTVRGWKAASQQARTIIAAEWAAKIGCNVVINGVEPTIPKWSLREASLRGNVQGSSSGGN